MRRWYVVARRDFAIWAVVHRILRKERMPDGRIRWLVEAPDYVRFLPKSVVQVSPVDGDETDEDRAA